MQQFPKLQHKIRLIASAMWFDQLVIMTVEELESKLQD